MSGQEWIVALFIVAGAVVAVVEAIVDRRGR